MGKKLIIKGADFSANSIPQPTIVWNEEFVEPLPTDNFFVNNYEPGCLGPYYAEGATVDGIKLSLAKRNLPQDSAPDAVNFQVGDTIRFSRVAIASPFNKTLLAEVKLTQQDFDRGFIVVEFEQQQQLSSSEFLGINSIRETDTSAILLIPCTFNMEEGVTTKWLNAAGTTVYSTISTGLATYYLRYE